MRTLRITKHTPNLFSKYFASQNFCTSNTFSQTDLIQTKLLGTKSNILAIYLNSPKNKNALSKKLLTSLKDQITYINSSDSIRCAILISKEPKYFCAGADLKERATLNESQIEFFVAELRQTFQDFADTKIPTIACIDGAALGGGLELALSADLRIGTKSSLIGLTEVSLGIIPGAGGTQRLPRLIGVSKAKELVFTAERINGQKAFELGILNYLVESYEELEAKGVEVAEKIVKNAPLALQNAKKAINMGIGFDLKTGLEIERLCYGNIIKTDDRVEGMKAFLEKRQPDYKGK
jgi:enoyl-CoA hydratase/carnithine racemase